MSGTLTLLMVVAVVVIGSLLLVRQSRRLSAGTMLRDESGQVPAGDPPEAAG